MTTDLPIRVVMGLLVTASMAAGCADECLTAEARCSGNAIESCLESDGFLGDHWGDDEDCERGTTCVDIEDPNSGRRRAFCASSRDPDPRCPANTNGYFDRCTDPDTLLRCYLGYSVERPCEIACIHSNDGVHGFCAM